MELTMTTENFAKEIGAIYIYETNHLNGNQGGANYSCTSMFAARHYCSKVVSNAEIKKQNKITV